MIDHTAVENWTAPLDAWARPTAEDTDGDDAPTDDRSDGGPEADRR